MTAVARNSPIQNSFNVDTAVRERYSRAAERTDAQLCCPIVYDESLLTLIPDEIRERDYGCGDPSKHVSAGETVLDLGSGGGKICYIAAQIVGRAGRVIGVDCNDEMLALARRHQPDMAQKLGFENVEFRKGRIQDLSLDLELLDAHLIQHPVRDSGDWMRLEEVAARMRASNPLVASDSVDVVVSNCVLNLVRPEDRRQMFREMARVLKRGGRVVISDIVADEEVPERLKNDSELWSGCISGAHREDQFLSAFEDAGFYGIEIVSRQEQPWAVVEGIEFRSVTVRAYHGKEGPCLDRRQAVVYNGPWKEVVDDDGHRLLRGQRMAVCDKTFNIYSRPPYGGQFTLIEPQHPIPLDTAPPFACDGGALRSPRETKSSAVNLTVLPEGNCCGPDGCC